MLESRGEADGDYCVYLKGSIATSASIAFPLEKQQMEGSRTVHFQQKCKQRDSHHQHTGSKLA